MPHPALIALTALIAAALRMQASLEAPLRLDILDYYSLYIRTQSSTRKDRKFPCSHFPSCSC